MTSKEYIHESVICSVIAKCYENLGLIANAEYFRQRGVFMLAKALESLALESKAKTLTKT